MIFGFSCKQRKFTAGVTSETGSYRLLSLLLQMHLLKLTGINLGLFIIAIFKVSLTTQPHRELFVCVCIYICVWMSALCMYFLSQNCSIFFPSRCVGPQRCACPHFTFLIQLHALPPCCAPSLSCKTVDAKHVTFSHPCFLFVSHG